MTRYRLDISYDGAAFSGWAAQGGGLRTVQDELQRWIGRILRLERPVGLVCAGRTDAGVHARGQVAHVDLPDAADSGVAATELSRRLTQVLPPDMVVNRVVPAPEGFDARFSALWRRYVYRLTDGVPDPLLRGHVLALRAPLNLAAVADAGTSMLGLHDFGAFCRRRDGASTVRTLLECTAVRVPASGSGLIEVTLRADAFCHSMVRSLVGGLVAVGSGRRQPAWLPDLLDRPSRAGDVAVLPPHGLVLEEVAYPPDADLASRATEARARRTRPSADAQDSRA